MTAAPIPPEASFTADGVVVEELTEAEERAIFDAEARRVLGISGEEFERRWRAGAYVGPEDPDVTHVAMLLPGAWGEPRLAEPVRPENS